MVRQWQEMFYKRRYAGVIIGQEERNRMEQMEKNEGAVYLPDFLKLAEAHGAESKRIFDKDEVAPALKEAFESGKTCVLEFIVEPGANVFPMIPPGQAVSAMVNRSV